MFPRKRDQVGVGDGTEEAALGRFGDSIVNDVDKLDTVFSSSSNTSDLSTGVTKTPSNDFTSHFVVRRNAANFDVSKPHSNETKEVSNNKCRHTFKCVVSPERDFSIPR